MIAGGRFRRTGRDVPDTRVLDTAGEDGADRARAPDHVAPGARPGEGAPGTLLQRLLWFGALWAAGVATVALAAYGIRAMILP